MVYLTRTEGSERRPPPPEGMARMGKLMEDAFAAGIVVATGQLGPTATKVRLEGDRVTVTDGPFIEGKELIPGFTVIRVDSREQAIAWATDLRRCMGDGDIRVIQVMGGR